MTPNEKNGALTVEKDVESDKMLVDVTGIYFVWMIQTSTISRQDFWPVWSKMQIITVIFWGVFAAKDCHGAT